MVRFKDKNGNILETNNKFLIEQYRKTHTEIIEIIKANKENKGKKKEVE